MKKKSTLLSSVLAAGLVLSPTAYANNGVVASTTEDVMNDPNAKIVASVDQRSGDTVAKPDYTLTTPEKPVAEFTTVVDGKEVQVNKDGSVTAKPVESVKAEKPELKPETSKGEGQTATQLKANIDEKTGVVTAKVDQNLTANKPTVNEDEFKKELEKTKTTQSTTDKTTSNSTPAVSPTQTVQKGAGVSNETNPTKGSSEKGLLPETNSTSSTGVIVGALTALVGALIVARRKLVK